MAMVKKNTVKDKKDVCIHCGGSGCSCSNTMKITMIVIGVIFLWVAWSLWTGAWSLEQSIAVLIAVWGIKKILLSFTKSYC